MLYDSVWAELYGKGAVAKGGAPKRLLGELDRLSATLTRIRGALPKSPEAAPAFDGKIPISLIKEILRDADADSPNTEVTPNLDDIIALEGRILARLGL